MKTTITRIETKVKIDAEGERTDLPGLFGRKPATVEAYEATVIQHRPDPTLRTVTNHATIDVSGSVIKKDGTPGLNSARATWTTETGRPIYPHISTAPEWVQNLVTEVTR